MRIEAVEIRNYRKLTSVRLDMASETTLLVGANNSGKTSALIALRSFLKQGISAFNTNDITISRWQEVNRVGEDWTVSPRATSAGTWDSLLPSLDVWLRVDDNEVHRVTPLIPNLDWAGGLVGVRFSIEPKNEADLAAAFHDAWKASDAVTAEWRARNPERDTNLALWPIDLVDFLSKHFQASLTIRSYVLDPAQFKKPEGDLAVIQPLPQGSEPLPTNPLEHIILIDEINAQRGFGDSSDTVFESGSGRISDSARLSRQLSDYYTHHLDPTDSPSVEDLDAIETFTTAQKEFDTRLKLAFKVAFEEMAGLSYPGVTDPSIRVSSKLNAVESLKHESAVSFQLDSEGDPASKDLYLPEGQNGLGYQNLISMVFRLMSFRDRWMRVGKALKQDPSRLIPPIHLVLVEEPEAHLHVQVQQVFAKKAFNVLRAHPDLGDKPDLTTQLVISTHSSHIAHELPFESLRYFRRLRAGSNGIHVPSSTVINVETAFGTSTETQKFVTRYLRVQHADVFFADALILVEGSAERMLLPHFIQKGHTDLHHAYVTMLEIGGSHAHRLRPLIEALKIPTLVVTDLDPKAGTGTVPTKRGIGQVTGNPTLKNWLNFSHDVDSLLDANSDDKKLTVDEQCSVRFAYQIPIVAELEPDSASEALPSTFEDALAFENIDFFRALEGTGLTRKFQKILIEGTEIASVAGEFHQALHSGSKAELALDVMASETFDSLRTPAYIEEGLVWLEKSIKKIEPDLSQVANEE